MPKNSFFLPLSLFLVTVVTRVPFTSKFLYHMDSVQFALALENYNITLHQPHPPGYFLYVMLGRFFHLFIKDANNVYIFISIFFSGITVVTVFYLGRELFNLKTGFLAALVTVTSPNLWFHGEVALSYIVEAFFSTAVALVCWKIYKGEHKYLWVSAITLGIAGGIRQNTIAFLLPLWLFSMKGVPPRKIIASVGVLGLVCLLWFLPMVWMTGGWDAYREAFRELWVFNTGKVSVFERGWSSLRIFSSALVQFTLYGVGTGVFVLVLAVYSLIRRKRLQYVDGNKVKFFILWMLPSVFFYLFIFIHPANPGYALIYIPAVCLLTAISTIYMSNELAAIFKKDLLALIMTILVVTNTFIFLALSLPASYPIIKNHDVDLPVLFNAIKSFEPLKTAVFVGPYIFFGYRHIMYYLPEYRVYQIDARTTSEGEERRTVWGFNGKTLLADEIHLPESIDTFVIPLIADDAKRVKGTEGVRIDNPGNSSIYLASGPFSLLKSLYPGLKVVRQRV